MRKIVAVRVEPITTEGKVLLNEIYPRINEGQVIIGRLRNKAVEFKHYGVDCILWEGDNCVIEKVIAKRK